jgi:hypothetical protein
LTLARPTLEDGGGHRLARDASGRGKKEYAKEAQAVATAPDDEAHPTNGAPADPRRLLARPP